MHLDISTIIFAAGVVCQAAITWWRTNTNDKAIAHLIEWREEIDQLVGKASAEHSEIFRRLDDLERKVFNGVRQ